MMKTYSLLSLLMIISWACVSCGTQFPETLKGDISLDGVKPYPLDTCLVIDRKLDSTPKTYTRVHQGQEVKFCCKNCVIAFEANPEPWMKKLKNSGR